MARREQGRRWSAVEAGAMLAEQLASGRTVEAFSRERGLCSQRLRWWRKRLGKEGSPSTFVPVRIVEGARAEVAFEVALRSGHVVRMVGCDVDALRALVTALEGGC